MALWLALDQGGQSSRAFLYDDKGEVVAQARREVAEQRPAPDRVEQDAEELVSSLEEAAREALAGRTPDGAALATQRSSVVCWDPATGAATTPVLSWQDRRAAAWLERFRADEAAIRARTGLPLSPHYGASKLRWCLDRLDGAVACGPLAAFLCFRLARERPFVVDRVNAARTLLFDPRAGDWDPWLLDRFGVPRAVLPACVPVRHPYGTLAGGAPLVAATGDQAAALFAFGPPDPETAYVNLGTGAFVQALAPGPDARADGFLTGQAGDDTFVLEGTVNGAASALNLQGAWRDELPGWLDDVRDPPLFLNGVSGLGAPFWVPDFESRFVGGGDRAARTVAVAESIVFLLAINLRGMAPRARRLLVTGGLAGLDGLCQRLANVTGLPVERPEFREATARGAAWLAAGGPDWPTGALRRFAPRRAPALLARFVRFDVEMRAALEG